MSAATRELLRRAVGSLRRTALWWSFAIVVLGLVNLAFWPALEGSEALRSFDDLGEAMEAFGAQGMSTPAGYLDEQLFAFMLPLLLSAMAVAGVTAVTAGDEQAGRLETLAALPVGRRRLWLTRWWGSAATVLAAGAVTAAVVVAGLPVFGFDGVAATRVLAATAGAVLLALFHAAVGYLLAGFGAGRGAAAGASIAVMLVGYVFALLLPLAEGLRWARSWSPWHWALHEQPVTEGTSPGGALLLVVLAAAMVAAGSAAVERRDLHGA